MCNTLCFSTATMIAQTRLHAMLYSHLLSCSALNSAIFSGHLVSHATCLGDFFSQDSVELFLLSPYSSYIVSGMDLPYLQWRTQEFWGGGSTNSVQDRGRENGDLGAVALYSGVPLNLQISETCILIRLLRMNFPWNWEFGSGLSKLRNFVMLLPTIINHATLKRTFRCVCQG
jgi:hypothetical protein